MKIKTIKVAYGRTIPLGKFNMVKIEAEYQADLDENEDDGEAIERLFELARQEVKNVYNQVRAAPGNNKATQLPEGQPLDVGSL